MGLKVLTTTQRINKKAQLSLTNSRDAVEIRVMDNSRSSKVTLFNCLHMVSYYRLIVTLCLKCTVFEMAIFWSKIALKTYPLSFGMFIGGEPLRIFWQVIPCQRVKSCGYKMVYISQTCFRSARHNAGCDGRTFRQADGYIVITKTALCIASRG